MGILDFFRRDKDKNSASENKEENTQDLSSKKNETSPKVTPLGKKTPLGQGWQDVYKKNLPHGLHAAGYHIQQYFQEKNVSPNAFRWIQTTLPQRGFQHLCFAYEGNIYSVIIEFFDGQHSYVLEQDVRNQIRECQANDLIPCTIVLRTDGFRPFVDGNHLILTNKRTPVVFKKREGDVRMSPWEINNFGISIVMNQLKKEGNQVLSYCDLLGVEPQIWFKDQYGKECYVIVKTISGSSKENLEYQVNHELIMKLLQYNGYYAEVGIAPADAVIKDENGEVMKLSDRDNFENPKEILYRDHGFYVNYTGLKYIERQAAEKSVTHKKLFDM